MSCVSRDMQPFLIKFMTIVKLFVFLYKIVGNNGGKLDVFSYLCAPKRAGGGLLREGNERHGACNSLVFRIIIN